MPSGDPFDLLDPLGRDGFRVERLDAGGDVELHVVVYQDGAYYNLLDLAPEDATLEVAAWADATPQDLGEAARAERLLEAICRYFTTGGSWRDLDTYLGLLRGFVPGGIAFPGYVLRESYVTTEGTWEHVFLPEDATPEAIEDGSAPAVLWAEDEFVVRQTLGEILDVQSGFGPTAGDPVLPDDLRPGDGHPQAQLPDLGPGG